MTVSNYLWMKSDLKLKKTGMNSEPRSQKEKVCSFFDKNKANEPSYIEELRKKRNQCDSVE